MKKAIHIRSDNIKIYFQVIHFTEKFKAKCKRMQRIILKIKDLHVKHGIKGVSGLMLAEIHFAFPLTVFNFV